MALPETPQRATPREIEEYDIRVWFMKVDLEQARDTFRVVEGILQTRVEYQPARKKRSDAGKPRNGELDLKESGK